MIKGKKTILCAIASVLFTNTVTSTISASAMQIEAKSSVTIMEVYNASSLNVRKGPSTSYSKLGSLKSGQTVEVISISNGWAKINYNNSTGYVSAQYLKNVSTNTPSSKKEMIVKVDDLNVRKGAGTTYSKIGSLKKGDKVIVVSTLSSGWVKIEFNGGYGYVSNVKGAYLQESTSTPSIPSEPSIPETLTKKYSAKEAINLRKTASWSGEIITVIKKGVTFDVISSDNNWAKVNYNNNIGYVPVSHIEKVESDTPSVPTTPDNPDTPSFKKEMIVKVNDLSVRTGSSTKNSKIGSLNKGDKVTVIDELSNGWVKIEFNGGHGYVSNVKGAYLEEAVNINQQNANKVIAMINNLNSSLTLDDMDAVEETRNAYNTLSSEAQALVTNLSKLTDAEAEISRLSTLETEKLNNIVDKIDLLEEIITVDNVESERAKLDEIDSLIEQLYAPFVQNISNLRKLEDIRNSIETMESNIIKSNEVVGMLEEIESLSLVSLDNKELVSKARMAYNNLSSEAKVMVAPELLVVLEEAENKIIDLENEASAKAVEDKIESLNRDIVITDYKTILEVRAEFEKLSPEAKLLVSNINILETAEEKIAVKKERYENAMDLIADLPEEITLEHKTQVQEAREAFNALEEDEKDHAMSINVHYQILIRAEETIQRLEEESQTEEDADETPEVDPVQSIQDKIASLMEREITLADKDTVVQIRQEYDALPNELKPQIIVGLIEELEMQIEGLEAVKSIQDKIESLQEKELTLEDKDTVVQIRQEYNALRSELKAQISEAVIEELELEIEGLEYANCKLDDVRKKEYEQKTANAVIEKINSLQKDILLTDYSSILTARREYDKLVPDAKLLVNNLDVLERAEVTIEAKKNRYDKAMNLIGGLPDDITLEHEAQIVEARQAFESLTPDEKEHALQFKEHYQLLTRAEEALERLKNGI